MVKIEISNRAMYFLVAFGIIALFAVGVFAVTPNPGHPASEIDGACHYDDDSAVEDWVNCPPNFAQEIGLHEAQGTLCYDSGSDSSCNLESASCTSERYVTGDQYLVDMNDCSFAEDDCEDVCRNTVACDGRAATSFSCGATAVNYNQASVESCNSNTEELMCYCSVSGVSYQSEVPSNAKCLLDDSSPTITTTTKSTLQHDSNCKSLGGPHDFCFLSSCKIEGADDDSAECYVIRLTGNYWNVCSIATNDDDTKAQAGAYCVDF